MDATGRATSQRDIDIATLNEVDFTVASDFTPANGRLPARSFGDTLAFPSKSPHFAEVPAQLPVTP
jgi:hypothetical protein